MGAGGAARSPAPSAPRAATEGSTCPSTPNPGHGRFALRCLLGPQPAPWHVQPVCVFGYVV
eukprot:14665323-Alexandrium_andersonii.AAC.1